MTKDEMTTLLRSVSCDENTITAMSNAYELGFDHGADVGDVMRELVLEAESICNSIDSAEPSVYPDTAKFWGLFDQLRKMQ